MKKISLLFALVIIISFTQQALCQSSAVNKSGAYTSFNDFTQNKLTLESKHSAAKSKAYGYSNTKNENYRFYDNSSYKIIDTLSFFIYYQYKLEEITKGKGLVKTDEYYFSIKGDRDILPLTISNLKKAFPDNSKFHYALDAMFRSDRDLLAYDNFLKIYKLKYIFKNSSTNTASAL